MRIIRYRQEEKSTFGILTPDGIVHMALGSMEEGFHQGERVGLLTNLRLLAPVIPSKIIAIGRNYMAHAAEFNREAPTEPVIFLKPPSTIITHGDTILLPHESDRVEHEAELAIVIGTRTSNVSEDDARSVVFGYTCANDVTARDLQFKDVQWTRGKGFDTFCPIGPWIETEFDPANKKIECRVNGEVRQQSNTQHLLFDVDELIRYISKIMTLEVGDVILTGTPEGVGRINKGDLVEVEVEGIGTLGNPAKDASA
jgi:2-keto-4-pentenoate hydratase/2-oxohepta-3-ene-1,7-dioic acid hydratase in catechol pathway